MPLQIQHDRGVQEHIQMQTLIMCIDKVHVMNTDCYILTRRLCPLCCLL